MAKLKETEKLAGIANVIPHQFIISDLIFGIRKRFAKNKKASSYRVISEISLIGFPVTIIDEKKRAIIIPIHNLSVLLKIILRNEAIITKKTIMTIDKKFIKFI